MFYRLYFLYILTVCQQLCHLCLFSFLWRNLGRSIWDKDTLLHYWVRTCLFMYLFAFKKLIFFLKDALNWSKVTPKMLFHAFKISISNECCSFEFSVHQIFPEVFFTTVFTKIKSQIAPELFLTLIIIMIRKVSWASNQHKEWFLKNRDTEDWSNDAENSALITALHFKIHLNKTLYYVLCYALCSNHEIFFSNKFLLHKIA